MIDETSRTNLFECRAIVDIYAAKSFFVRRYPGTVAYICCYSQRRNGRKPYSLAFSVIVPQDTNETIAFQVKARDSGDGLSFNHQDYHEQEENKAEYHSWDPAQSGSMYTTSIVLCKLSFR